MNIKRAGFVFLSLIILGGLFILNGQEEQPIKIAVASEGETIDSQVSSQGARCSWFLLFNEEGTLTDTLENPYQQTRGDAGIKCAKLLKDHEVTVFVAGNVGEKMAEALESKGIAFIAFQGTVKDAVERALRKNTAPAAPAGNGFASL